MLLRNLFNFLCLIGVKWKPLKPPRLQGRQYYFYIVVVVVDDVVVEFAEHMILVARVYV